MCVREMECEREASESVLAREGEKEEERERVIE